MQIAQPYLLFLGDVTDPLAAKTARGIHQWRPDICLGQLRLTSETVSLGLTDMTLQQAQQQGAKTLVIGTTNPGGVIPKTWQATLTEAAEMGFEIASGMHQRLTEFAPLSQLEQRGFTKLHDVRHYDAPLKVGNGKARLGKRVLTVGTDCSVGKMYSALALESALRRKNCRAEFQATGQTGILIAGSGISIDAVVADFISGAVEAISPTFSNHDWDIIEGQGSLFNPSFAGVSLGLLHGAQADALVLCHEIGRAHIRNLPHANLPTIEQAIAANLQAARLTNPQAQLVGICLNTSAIDEQDARQLCQDWSGQYRIPVTDPVRFGVDTVADNILTI
ncbi:putative NAD-dependent epimerase/dehydratase family protein [Vibrio sp. ES.051]|uniref:N-acetyltransferase DgcN n=1 Tax=Vibrio sp. ES.051 TaxID=1761909 RepID=UPI000BF9D686|nr:N-acetyltransferase DgcN [Vibrio sp. ES.051]PFG57761.1 putative NAD-dependent epimerase/dehydratase family protein [Vibrio sp. ES.051]